MKLDSTTLRLIRAASQAVANECSAIIGDLTGTPVTWLPDPAATTPSAPESTQPVAAAAPSKRTRGKAAASAEPVVVTDTPPVTNVEQPTAPASVTPAPVTPAPVTPAPVTPAPVTPATALPPQSTVTDQELAALAEVLKADPEKLRLYQAWRDSSEFLQPDGTLASGKGLPLSKIPNVGDNRDRLLEALKRALV